MLFNRKEDRSLVTFVMVPLYPRARTVRQVFGVGAA